MFENSLSTREKREKHAIYRYDMFLWCFSVCVSFVVVTFYCIYVYISFCVIRRVQNMSSKDWNIDRDNLNGNTNVPFFHMNIIVRLNDRYNVWKISYFFHLPWEMSNLKIKFRKIKLLLWIVKTFLEYQYVIVLCKIYY